MSVCLQEINYSIVNDAGHEKYNLLLQTGHVTCALFMHSQGHMHVTTVVYTSYDNILHTIFLLIKT